MPIKETINMWRNRATLLRAASERMQIRSREAATDAEFLEHQAHLCDEEAKKIEIAGGLK